MKALMRLGLNYPKPRAFPPFGVGAYPAPLRSGLYETKPSSPLTRGLAKNHGKEAQGRSAGERKARSIGAFRQALRAGAQDGLAVSRIFDPLVIARAAVPVPPVKGRVSISSLALLSPVSLPLALTSGIWALRRSGTENRCKGSERDILRGTLIVERVE